MKISVDRRGPRLSTFAYVLCAVTGETEYIVTRYRDAAVRRYPSVCTAAIRPLCALASPSRGAISFANMSDVALASSLSLYESTRHALRSVRRRPPRCRLVLGLPTMSRPRPRLWLRLRGLH